MTEWFFSSGDAPFFYSEQIARISWLPALWNNAKEFGENVLPRLWLDYPFRLVVKILSTMGLSWFFIDKLLWLSVFCLCLYSSYRLAKYVIRESSYCCLASLIYTANTYFLLLFSGGQLGVAAAYAFAPWVLVRFMSVRRVISNGLFLALLIVFDLRIAYLVVGAVVLYLLIEKRFSSFLALGGSLLAAMSVHLFWILPAVFTGAGPGTLGGDFINPGMLKFLSVADFSHALSLLHPNWPENLFGKVYFLQPEFLLLPIIAFSSLLFKDKKIRFFAFLAFIGAFFAKGVNDPAGGIFQWMFVHVPGFVMFRDPTKFYLFTAIGYSILIPFTLERINKKIAVVIFVVFWLFTIRAVFLGQVQGNFNPMKLPAEYVRLKNLIVADSVPSRSLWIPGKENFAFSSDIHPILTASTSAVIDPSVKYVIVPQDLNKRIFLNDYKFDPSLRKKIVENLSETRLKPISSFHDIAVFENPEFSGMHVGIPAIVEKQQQLANVGLGISIALIIFLWFRSYILYR